MNFLSIRWIRVLLGWRLFPIIPQLIMLLTFLLLILGAIGITADDTAFINELRNTNLPNLIVWSYWWPLIIIAAILIGRVWCMVCPMELVTYLAGCIGLRQKVPHLLKTGWAITIFYTLILIVGIHTLNIHRMPHRMALYLIMLLGAAVVVSLIYEKRAFCSYICPVGHLLGLYALIAPFEWRADDSSVCQQCKTKDCFVKRNHYRLVGRSCTSNLYPATIKNNRDCLLCTQCLKVCPYDNLRLSPRWSFADLVQFIQLTAAQVGFIVVVSGFVVYEILSEWNVSRDVLLWIPNQLTNVLQITGSAASFVSAIILFIIFPTVLFLTVGALVKTTSKTSLRKSFEALALLLIPTMAAAHILKSVLKMAPRIPYWPYAFSDPEGVETAQKILNKTIVLNKTIPDALYPAISYLAVVLLITGLVATLFILLKAVVIRKLQPMPRWIIALGVFAYWGIFGLTILKWRF